MKQFKGDVEMADKVQVPPEGIEMFRTAFGSCRLTSLVQEGDIEKMEAEIVHLGRYYDLGGAGRAAIRAWEQFCRMVSQPTQTA